MEQFGIVFMPYDVTFIINLLELLEYPGWGEISQTQMYNYLVEIDYDNYILDNTALEEFFAYMGIDS
jgi:hypothetical protein